MNTDPIVIVGLARTPVGAFQGELKGFTAPELGAAAIRAAVERAKIRPEEIDEVIMGCVLPAGQGQAPARQASLAADRQREGLRRGRCGQPGRSSLMRRNVTRLLLLLLFMAAGAHAADERRDNWFTVTLENDFFMGQDTGYTNGFALSWAHAGFTEFSPDNMPRWLHYLSKNLYISTMPGKQRAVSYMIGQLMQTPSDINTPTLIENEAPYAGLLFWSANLHAFDDRVADRLSLTLGVVGPLSGAEQTQKWVHDIVGADEPKGWDNQIGNEPVFQVSAERLLRLAKFHTDKTVGMDVIGTGNGAVGTIESYLAVGVGARLGHGLDRSFPAANFLPGRQVNPLAGSVTGGWYVFANVQGRFVANDFAINGNTFKDSHSVPLEHWQAAAAGGVAFGFKRWAFLLSALVGTDRYEGQPDTTRFGSLSVTYNY